MEDRTGAGWLQRFRVCAGLVEAEGTEGGTWVLWYFDRANLEIGRRLGLLNGRDIGGNCAVYENAPNYLTAIQRRGPVEERSTWPISARSSSISVKCAAQSHQINAFGLIRCVPISVHWHCGAQHGIRR